LNAGLFVVEEVLVDDAQPGDVVHVGVKVRDPDHGFSGEAFAEAHDVLLVPLGEQVVLDEGSRNFLRQPFLFEFGLELFGQGAVRAVIFGILVPRRYRTRLTTAPPKFMSLSISFEWKKTASST